MTIIDGFVFSIGAFWAVIVLIVGVVIVRKVMRGGIQEMTYKDLDRIIRQREAAQDYEHCAALLEAKKYHQKTGRWPNVMRDCIEPYRKTTIKLDQHGFEAGIVTRFRWRDNK